MSAPINQQARRLFAPLGDDYDRWSRVLSFGQDPRWRRAMIDAMHLSPGARVLDVAAGTGMVSELLRRRGCQVVALDQSREMLMGATRKGVTSVLANAESLPFADETFDALTFTYLLRYVSTPLDCLRELVRVVRRGGPVGMVEFGVPAGIWQPLWRLYTGVGLPAIGSAISPGWKTVGGFLGPSITAFQRSYPEQGLARMWESAGLTDVRVRRMSLGGGLVMWGRRA